LIQPPIDYLPSSTDLASRGERGTDRDVAGIKGRKSSRNTVQGDSIRRVGRGREREELYVGDKTFGNGVTTKTYCVQNAGVSL
jgi:hypothetical protein